MPCDEKIECQDAADESWLCTQQSVIVYAILGMIFEASGGTNFQQYLIPSF